MPRIPRPTPHTSPWGRALGGGKGAASLRGAAAALRRQAPPACGSAGVAAERCSCPASPLPAPLPTRQSPIPRTMALTSILTRRPAARVVEVRDSEAGLGERGYVMAGCPSWMMALQDHAHVPAGAAPQSSARRPALTSASGGPGQ